MKRIAILTFMLFTFAGLQSQVNENIKKETTVKKVTVKDTNIETVIDKEISKSKSVINVEGTNEMNQESNEIKVSDETKHTIVVKEKVLNVENQNQLEKLKKEETKQIDGQQRGVPVQTDADTKVSPKVSTQSEKVEVKMIDGQQRGAPTQMEEGATIKPKTSIKTKKEGGGK